MKLILLLIMPWHLLTWSDFRGKPNTNDAACTSAGSSLTSGVKNNKFYYYATTDFDAYNSWTVTHDKYVLKHEQGHLDIAEIFTRKLNHDLLPYQGLDIDAFEDVLKIQDRNGVEREIIQHQYDFETNHSINREAQERWNKWIAEQLKKSNVIVNGIPRRFALSLSVM